MDSPAAPSTDGFSWSGDLDETNIRAVYARCQSLRFSGKLDLKDGAHAAQVRFLGGEPVEIDGADTGVISMWASGSFVARQTIPDLQGDLTDAVELTGSMTQVKASALWAWVGEYRLSCEIELQRPGSRAVVSFTNGHAEGAQVNGMPELAALARVSAWTDGTFRVRLRPLFSGKIAPASPLQLFDASPLQPRQFDVSRSIPMDLKNRAGEAARGSPSSVTPPLGELAHTQIEARSAQLERTALTKPLPSPLEADQILVPKSPRMRAVWIAAAAVLVVGIAAGVTLAYHHHLPPFSPPPRPLEKPAEPTVEPAKAEPSSGPEALKTAEPAPPSAEVAAPATKAPPPPEPAPSLPPSSTALGRDRPSDKLVQKSRQLLIEGHKHTAIELLRRAQKLSPKDPAIRVLEQQALGKLGQAELELEGKGSLTVDGHKFAGPRRLKVAAGPHLVDAGDGEKELSLKRGERRRLKLRH